MIDNIFAFTLPHSEFSSCVSLCHVQEPPTLSSGMTTLRGTWMFNFDRGIEGAEGDVWWEMLTPIQRQLTPRDNARIVNIGFTSFDTFTPSRLQALPYGTDPIPGNNDASNQLLRDDVFAVLTNGGNMAKVQVGQRSLSVLFWRCLCPPVSPFISLALVTGARVQ